MATTDKSTRPALWLAEGEEECTHCLGTYVFEQEVRCIVCDGPMCPRCAWIVRQKDSINCPSCEKENKNGRSRDL
jgi:hypothetical protein